MFVNRRMFLKQFVIGFASALAGGCLKGGFTASEPASELTPVPEVSSTPVPTTLTPTTIQTPEVTPADSQPIGRKAIAGIAVAGVAISGKII